MIPLLYDKAINRWSLLQPSRRLIGRLRDCISCVVTEERNGIYECDFEYPVTGMHFDKIQLQSGIVVTHDDTGDMQPFEVVSYSRPINGIVTFHAVHVSYRLNKFVLWAMDPHDFHGEDITNINSLNKAMHILNLAMAETGVSYWAQFNFSSDYDGIAHAGAFDGIPRTARSLLGGVEGSILDTYGGEYEWDRFNVKLHNKGRGVKRDFAIRYGVNMMNFQDDVDASEAIYGYVPYWTGQGSEDQEITVTGQAVYSNEMTTDTIWIMPLDLSGAFETQPTATQLQEMAMTKLQTESPFLPVQTIKVDFVRLQDEAGSDEYDEILTCNLCDQIRVVFPDYDMSEYFKIVKTEYNVLADRYDSMELGTLSMTLAEALGK